MVYSILTQKQREKFENELELDTSIRSPAGPVPCQRVPAARLGRLRDAGDPYEIVGFDMLGIPAVVGDLGVPARGLVLVTGPTGSGKSTTLRRSIDIVNPAKPVHIMTVEDPIEFLHTHKRC